MKVAPAVVIPVSPGHVKNLRRVVDALGRQTVRPSVLVVVAHRFGLAGRAAISRELEDRVGMPWTLAVAHDEQAPRTVGAKVVARDMRQYGVREVAFLDSDIHVGRTWLEILADWMEDSDADVIAGPYEFLPENMTVSAERHPNFRNDTRWPLFNLSRVRYGNRPNDGLPTWAGDVTRGLGLYGGNLLWDLDKFLDLGGFRPLVRGEDGELGIRAARADIEMGFAWDARGWHQWHPVDIPQILEQNRRDIPKIWAAHGDYLEAHGIRIVEEDGMRLNIRDTAGWDGNTALLWQREMERPEGVEWVRP